MLKKNPSLDLQGDPSVLVKIHSEMSRKSDVISLLTIDNDIELKGNDDSG